MAAIPKGKGLQQSAGYPFLKGQQNLLLQLHIRREKSGARNKKKPCWKGWRSMFFFIQACILGLDLLFNFQFFFLGKSIQFPTQSDVLWDVCRCDGVKNNFGLIARNPLSYPPFVTYTSLAPWLYCNYMLITYIWQIFFFGGLSNVEVPSWFGCSMMVLIHWVWWVFIVNIGMEKATGKISKWHTLMYLKIDRQYVLWFANTILLVFSNSKVNLVPVQVDLKDKFRNLERHLCAWGVPTLGGIVMVYI